MNNNKQVVVGQTVYSLAVDRRTQQELRPQVVSRVGRSYFYYEQYGSEVKISLSTFTDKTNTGMCYSVRVYLSQQDKIDEVGRAKTFEVVIVTTMVGLQLK